MSNINTVVNTSLTNTDKILFNVYTQNFLDDDFETTTTTSTKTTNKVGLQSSKVIISLQQRNGKKCLTLIEGLASDLDKKKILRYMKRTFSTNGTILCDPDTNAKVLQLQGDKRQVAKLFLTKCKICDEANIIVRGF